jgi:hypothetical protein
MRRRTLIIASVMLLCFSAAFAPPAPPSRLSQDTLYQEDFETARPGLESRAWLAIQSDDGNQVLEGQGHGWARANEFFDGVCGSRSSSSYSAAGSI